MREIKFRVWDKEENKFYPIFNLEEYIVWNEAATDKYQ